jgi:hypothetical protein
MNIYFVIAILYILFYTHLYSKESFAEDSSQNNLIIDTIPFSNSGLFSSYAVPFDYWLNPYTYYNYYNYYWYPYLYGGAYPSYYSTSSYSYSYPTRHYRSHHYNHNKHHSGRSTRTEHKRH